MHLIHQFLNVPPIRQNRYSKNHELVAILSCRIFLRVNRHKPSKWNCYVYKSFNASFTLLWRCHSWNKRHASLLAGWKRPPAGAAPQSNRWIIYDCLIADGGAANIGEHRSIQFCRSSGRYAPDQPHPPVPGATIERALYVMMPPTVTA